MGAATFGWLCVETDIEARIGSKAKAATFGWLCVETDESEDEQRGHFGSHLRVAVC